MTERDKPHKSHFLKSPRTKKEQKLLDKGILKIIKNNFIPEKINPDAITALNRPLPKPITSKEFDYRLKYLEKKLLSKKAPHTENKSTILNLNKNGDLYINSDQTSIYEMASSPQRLSILKILAKQQGEFYNTSVLAHEIGTNNEQALRKAVAAINKHVSVKLGLQEKLIQASPRAGYRINPYYKILLPLR